MKKVGTKVRAVSVNDICFGQTVKRKRKEQKMTQEELAEQLDLSTGLIGQIERGDTYPSFETFVKIVKILNIDPVELIYGKPTGSNYVELDLISRQMSPVQRKTLLEIAKILIKNEQV